MAPAAAENSPLRLAALARLLAPRPGRLEFAARLALICALTALVTEIYQTPEPALATYVAFFVTKPDRVSSVVACLLMTVVITVVLGGVLLVAQFVLDFPAWRVASMALISFGLLFLVSASKLRPLAGTMALMTAYGLDRLGSVPAGELATRGLLYAWLFVGIPAAVALVVSLLLAPSPRTLVQHALAGRLRLAAAALRGADEATAGALAQCIRGGDAEIQGGLKLAGVERTSPPEDIVALRHAADATVVLLSAVDFMARTPGAMLPEGTRTALADTVEQMAGILATGGYPVGVTLALPDDEALAALPATALAAVKDALLHFAEPAPAVAPAPAAAAAAAAAATAAPSSASEPAPAPGGASSAEAGTPRAPLAPAAVAAPLPAPAPSGFLAPDAFTNPDHVRYALKTTLAAMFCYLLFSVLDWPGIHTCLITCYIVSLNTMADSVEKLGLRIAGCAVGAAAGIGVMTFIVPSVTSIGGLLVIVFLGGLASAWVAAGSARISYAGFQMAFAFFICVVQGAGPAFDMVEARDRVIGILLGNVVVYIVSAHIWPVSVRARIEAGIGAITQRLSLMAQATSPAARRRRAAEAQAALGTTEADLALAQYEPDWVRPEDAWLDQRRDVVTRAGALHAPLLLLASAGHGVDAGIEQRLDRLAGKAAAPATPGATPPFSGSAGSAGSASIETRPLRTLVDARLRHLENAWTALDRPQGEVSHAPA
ncbi:FUSC family protein [Variovorax rhizosphaerae]|uniref:FUSC family protein n=1 Tax=Variovorax rhizosphaerae TaxID=1836200 RepID=A0ABU8WD78_9BURK